MEDVYNFLNIGHTNPIWILNQHEIFWRFCICPSNDTFGKNKKKLMSVLGLNSKDRKSTRDKANISNPKVNRGCAPLTANRISADCVQISLGPSIPYIPLGVYHTGGFNAIICQCTNGCLIQGQNVTTKFKTCNISRVSSTLSILCCVLWFDTRPQCQSNIPNFS